MEGRLALAVSRTRDERYVPTDCTLNAHMTLDLLIWCAGLLFNYDERTDSTYNVFCPDV